MTLNIQIKKNGMWQTITQKAEVLLDGTSGESIQLTFDGTDVVVNAVLNTEEEHRVACVILDKWDREAPVGFDPSPALMETAHINN